jgi:hypothetical protein
VEFNVNGHPGNKVLKQSVLGFVHGLRARRAVNCTAIVFVLAVLVIPASAHVGSPDVFLEGNAGPYKLFVTVRVPQVIPGVAEIEIRSESPDVNEIRVAPMQLTGPGSQYAPAPEAAERSKGDPQFFRGSLWLMEFGSLQVRVEADGTQGKGLLAVPIPAIAQRTLPMQRPLGLLLFALMSFLAAGLVLIVGAAVREANLPPGDRPSGLRERRVRIAGAMAGFLVIAVLTVGALWWRSDAQQYASHIYSPPEIQAIVQNDGELILRGNEVRIASGNPRRPAAVMNFDDLILDHEHLMHLFIMSSPGMNRFWHLHPERTGSNTFTQNLPAMPAGHYQIFADVVLNTGFPITMIGQFDLPSDIPGRELRGDDCGITTNSRISDMITAEPTNSSFTFADGARMIWERVEKPLHAGIPLILRFRVTDEQGNPAHDLEPYMGMAAHAEIIRSDSSVFAHIHPTGSVPMPSFVLAQATLPGTGANPAGGMSMAMDMSAMRPDNISPEISFPYGFPKPGIYRIFIQIKRAGQIQTAFFDAAVN